MAKQVEISQPEMWMQLEVLKSVLQNLRKHRISAGGLVDARRVERLSQLAATYKAVKMHMSVAQAYATLEHSSVVELPAYIRRVPGSIPGVPIF